MNQKQIRGKKVLEELFLTFFGNSNVLPPTFFPYPISKCRSTCLLTYSCVSMLVYISDFFAQCSVRNKIKIKCHHFHNIFILSFIQLWRKTKIVWIFFLTFIRNKTWSSVSNSRSKTQVTTLWKREIFYTKKTLVFKGFCWRERV